MGKVLDIVPLRSFVAIADTGGFHRAATRLSLTQSAVSQHVRKLEGVLGRQLVEPSGRGTRFTADGERLLIEARRILEVHDQGVERLLGRQHHRLVIGATDHAAEHLLPPLLATLGEHFPELEVQFRFDRTTRLNEAVDQGSVDVAVFISEASAVDGADIGSLALRWCAAPGFEVPAGQPLPLVAIQAPCAIRATALRVLAEHDIAARVAGDAAYLAGVLNSARAGLGIALVALAGPLPEGLAEFTELPPVNPIRLSARVRRGAEPQAAETVLRTLRRTLAQAPTLVHA